MRKAFFLFFGWLTIPHILCYLVAKNKQIIDKDIVWLDYARTFGIFLVIFGHCLQTFPAWKSNECLRGIWDYVYLFHMPLFFIISGFLFKAPNVNRANIRYGEIV